MSRIIGALAAAAALIAGAAHAEAARPDQESFRGLYQELVETNTTGSVGSCTEAAHKMGARLKAVGFADDQLTYYAAPEWPKSGGLVAVYPGRDPKAKAILLLAHIDVVEAKREDWTRDPFTLVEENGYFYGRGSSDDKAQGAIWVDSLIRYKAEGFKPKRPIKLALTCGEEGSAFNTHNGVRWLTENRRDLIDAAFALNEGGGGSLDANGKRVANGVEAGEKTSQSFILEVTNPGGHSSRPVPDNAIYHLADAIGRIRSYEFPVQLNDVTRGFLTRMSKISGGEAGAAMTALVADPANKQADALLSQDPSIHNILRTTCVATMLSGGHAQNALPQRANATVNCRIFPGENASAVHDTLIRVIADPAVSVSQPTERPAAPGPPLTREVMGPIETLTEQMWPGVPVVPMLLAAGTDGTTLIAAGIPTYGVSGLFLDPDLGRMHGLNERIKVTSLYEGRDFLYRLVKIYADQK